MWSPPTLHIFIVQTSCASLCHTDVYLWQGKVKLYDDVSVPVEAMSPDWKWPVILGEWWCYFFKSKCTHVAGCMHALVP